jgi:iron complex outermembrane receptor protein
MKSLKFASLIFILNFNAYLSSADEELVVTGSYLKDQTIEASPIEIMSAEKISDLSLSSISEISKFIHTSSGSHFQSDSLEGTDQGMANINLRGLNLSATLVMVNSIRNTVAGVPAESGDSYVDINLIPQIAIQQLEIFKEGATSLYGSDAIAGVINFKTYKNFDGTKVKLTNQKTQHYGQSEHGLGLLHGLNLNDIDIVFGLELFNRASLHSSEIAGISELGISIFGNTFIAKEAGTFASSGSYSGNIYDIDDKIKDPDCIANGGTLYVGYCGFVYGDRFNIFNDEDHEKLYLSLERSFLSYDLSSTLLVSRVNVNDNPQSPSYPALSFPEIGVGKAGSPFNKAVIWKGRPLGASSPSRKSKKNIDQYHLSSSLNFYLSESDNFLISLSSSQHKNNMSRPDTVSSRFTAALNNIGGPENNLTWNLFDYSQNNSELKEYIQGSEDSLNKSNLFLLDGIYSQELNNFKYILGFQLGSESLDVTWNETARVDISASGQMTKAADLLFLGGGSNINSQRSKYSIFAEVNPLLSDDLDINLSMRFEEIGNESSFDPKISLKKYLNKEIIFRGSIGTSFSMPSLGQLYSARTSLNNIDGSFVRVSKLGNIDLKPQSSTNSNIGLIYKGKQSKLSLDYWQIDYKDRLTVESATALYNSNPNNPIFTYNGSTLYAANIKYINEEKTDLSGFDLSFNIEDDIDDIGTLNFGIDAAYLKKYKTIESGLPVDRNGRFNYDVEGYSLPKLKINVFSKIKKDRKEINLNARYISGYDNFKSLSSRSRSIGGYSNKVSSSLMLDLMYKQILDFNNSKLDLSISILNISDEQAPKVNSQPEFSFDPRQADPRGRMFSLGLQFNL